MPRCAIMRVLNCICMMKPYFLVLSVLMVMGAGCVATEPAQKKTDEYISPEKQQMMDAKENSDQVGGYPEAVPGGEREVKIEAEKAKEYNKKVFSGEIIAGRYSPLLAFTPADYEKAAATGKLVVLYFYETGNSASEKDFSQLAAAFNAISDNGTVGFRVLLEDPNAKNIIEKFKAKAQTKVFMKGTSVIRTFTDSWRADQYKKEILLQTK